MNSIPIPSSPTAFTSGLSGIEILSERVSEYPFYKEIFDRCDWHLLPTFMQKPVNKYSGELALSDVWDLDDNKAISKQLRGVRAICWEFECVRYAQNNQFDFDVGSAYIKKESLKRLAYNKNDSFLNFPEEMEDRLYMQNDVPIVSKDTNKPIWLEAKSSWFSSYGTAYGRYANSSQHLNVSSLNQLLRYQAALDQGLIESAAVVIDGRIHPNMWKWMTEGPDGSGSLIPGVEVLWALPLPYSHSSASTLVKVKEGSGPSLWRPDSSLSLRQEKFVEAFVEKSEQSKSWLADMLKANLTVMEVMESYYKKKLTEAPKPHPMSFKPWMVSYTDVEAIYVTALRNFIIDSVNEPKLKLSSKPTINLSR